MAETYLSRLLAVMRRNEERMLAVFEPVVSYASEQLLMASGEDGTISRRQTLDLQAKISARVVGLFLGRNRLGEFDPFEHLPDGSIFPLAPYPRALYTGLEEGVRLAVQQHSDMLAEFMPAPILAVMKAATKNPFAIAKKIVGEPVAEQMQPNEVFNPNTLAVYDAPHTWVDPNGYRLSDRIWNASMETRRRIDMFLDERIAKGVGAREIAEELEQFLLPGRKLKRTKTPYGTDASYDAMRLARTEITRAHARASEESATMNPFVSGLRVVLSRSHPERDICDDAVADGPWPKNAVPDHYKIPLHPHCLCHYGYIMDHAGAAEAIEALSIDIELAREELAAQVGPAKVDEFTRLLLKDTPLEEVRAAPEPVQVTHDLGEFESTEEAELWAETEYPNINFDFEGADIDAINPTVVAFHRIAQDWPQVTDRLKYVGTYLGKDAPADSFGNAEYAHATVSGTRIGINPKFFGDARKLVDNLQEDFDSNWLDADGSVESVMTHEFGHMIEAWLLSHDEMYFIPIFDPDGLPFVSSDDTGVVSKTIQWFNKINVPTEDLSRYATKTNHVSYIPEGWAEAISAIYHQDPKEWTSYVKYIKTALDIVGNTENWTPMSEGYAYRVRDWDPDAAFNDRAKRAAGPELFDKVVAEIRRIKKELNLIL